jgi:hypothetical protein
MDWNSVGVEWAIREAEDPLCGEYGKIRRPFRQAHTRSKCVEMGVWWSARAWL